MYVSSAYGRALGGGQHGRAKSFTQESGFTYFNYNARIAGGQWLFDFLQRWKIL